MKLTKEQIKNWRKLLSLTLGPYAFLAPDEEIQEIRDKLQKQVNDELDEIPKEKK